MTARGEKPLPDLPLRAPHPQDPAALSLDARAHLHRFILHSLEEDNALADESESWAGALEGALFELGTSISSGGWLTGLKRGRALKAKRERDEGMPFFVLPWTS